jgi:hypothetical protein
MEKLSVGTVTTVKIVKIYYSIFDGYFTSHYTGCLYLQQVFITDSGNVWISTVIHN